MHLSIDLERCLCIHSLSQVVDITIQVLLYQRQIIPEPANLFLGDNTSRESEKFKTIYERVKAVIRSLFCSMNCALIREFIILIGPFTYLPKEVYRIPIVACRKHLDAENKAGCGQNCGDMTLKEQRKIFSSIICNSDEISSPNKADKVFFFVSTSGPILKEVDELEVDASFELPSQEQLERLKIQELFVEMKSPCLLEENVTNNKDDEIWHRVLPYFTRLT